MVGAGIYVLIGTIAGEVGLWAPVVFFAAALVAAPTALVYSALSSAIPESAGEAAYIRKVWRREWLAVLVGFAIVTVGTTSAATVLQGGIGYLQTFTTIPAPVLIIAVGLLLTGIAVAGVLESLLLASLFTVIELVGLAIIIWVGLSGPASSPDWSTVARLPPLAAAGPAVLLAFFAFVGFEDMVNMAEEVRQPRRSLPIAILTALVITSLLYGLVALAAVRSAALADLAASSRPLVLVYEVRTGNPGRFLAAISVAAALNGVLAQLIMAARILYGLGRDNPALASFHHTHPRFQTPHRATALVGLATVLMALLVPMEGLAELTSIILLTVFAAMNLTMIRLHRVGGGIHEGFPVPTWVAWMGLIAVFLTLVVSLAGLTA